MFLKSIYLKNVKCFENAELSFMEQSEESIRQWTLLLGENGTGKSTLLKAIALIVGGSEALSDLLSNPGDWIRNGVDQCEISAVLVTKDLEERSIYLKIHRGDSRRDILFQNEAGLSLLDRALEHSERNYFAVGFGVSRRLNPPDIKNLQTSNYHNVRAQNVATLFDPGATLNPLESWAMDLDYTHDMGLETVRSVLNDFLPDVTFNSIDKKNKQLLFETADGIVPLRSLSDGYQGVAAWIGDLLFRIMKVFGDYNTPLDARGLLLIDEVDLHLHPQWQRQLISFLGRRLPNFQLIATTHSPMTAQQAGPDQLYYLEREKDRVSIEPFIGNPRELLLSQLVMTDAFGLQTDESLELETKKERYRDLRDKKRSKGIALESVDEQEFEQLKDELSSIPINNKYMLMSEDEKKLLENIQQERQRG